MIEYLDMKLFINVSKGILSPLQQQHSSTIVFYTCTSHHHSRLPLRRLRDQGLLDGSRDKLWSKYLYWILVIMF